MEEQERQCVMNLVTLLDKRGDEAEVVEIVLPLVLVRFSQQLQV